ncbi:hypothetical protein [Paraburkholderia panacisoli]|uniref:hypothetical protein n=1 Tax=Paraburkholderia panacisoli TaxID=2603818 RepID=UPI00165F65B8|nr:hypothetical protein [Paraburkholderia panacisoli]
MHARNERYLICTRPFNPQRTVLYTTGDWVDEIRGPDNVVFSMGLKHTANAKNS